ncbi:LysM domain-containing protein [Gryllotalpicola koreensis]|uniref:LysM domain-containing protein n=1 Tax=Gryllotalpicola koreensis TaxID=993086 RepID=A0ABP8A6J8_9MICO
MRKRNFAAIGVAAMMLLTLSGCFAAGTTPAKPKHAHALSASPSASPSMTPTLTAPPTPTEAPNPAMSHLATPEPVSTPEPSPTLTPVPAGTVVAQGDVASPKGSIHFHYRVVANGDNSYAVQYSGFTSTVPVPVSVTLIDIPPRVGDGLTWHGVADHVLGGPTTSAASASSASLGAIGQPSYLTTLVTYSSVASADGVPVELGPNKVLAVNTLHWSIPVRQSNVHPVDGGPRQFATGTVTAKTSTGAPRSYRVAAGDVTSVVAARFGITVTDLIWLNKNLQVFGDQQYLYADTTLNLDPDRL